MEDMKWERRGHLKLDFNKGKHAAQHLIYLVAPDHGLAIAASTSMSTSSPLLRLPTEILDEILSSLAEPHDLLALALASRSCARLVIPQHIEYRTIRIRTPMPAMWAHLARRKDLTRNIRELRFCARGDYTAPDRGPSTLVEPLRPEAEGDEQMRMRNVCVAIGYMRDLET
ncbi:hypothetical protein FPV67DRAFT_1473981, partial [Lyophyllum atratum]